MWHGLLEKEIRLNRRVIREQPCCNADIERDLLNAGYPIFLQLAWYKIFDRYVRHSDGNTLSLYLHGDDERAGFLPLYEEKSSGCRHLYSLTNFYSPAFDLLGSGYPAARDYEHFVRQFRRFFRNFGRADFSPLTHEQANNWKRAFSTIGFQGFVYRKSTNWFYDGITDLDSYWKTRPSRLRNTIKRKSERLRRAGGFEVSVVHPDSRLALWNFLAHYHHVYYASWKRAEPFPAFIDAIVEYAWQLGQLRMGIAYHHGKPVASQIWFVHDQRAYIFKLAHEPE